MNAVEKLEAAIAKLETAKRYAPDGPWSLETQSREFIGSGYYIETSVVAAHGGPLMTESYANTAALIVTLHRTIEPQLAILRLAIQFDAISPNRYTEAALDLAAHILGESNADVG